MPFYHKLGDFPHKRHTAFRNKKGELYEEHLMGNHGFSGLQSLLYTIRRPTSVIEVETFHLAKWEAEPQPGLQLRHFRTHRLSTLGGSPSTERIPVLFNNDLAISIAFPRGTDDYFYRNSQGDEIVFITEGSGVLESQMGELDYQQGDYVIIPRGIIHRFRPHKKNQIFLIVESRGSVATPARYRNAHGQLLEHSPFCERDLRAPSRLKVHDERGEFPIVTKQENMLNRVVLDHHPFDTVGWDGYYFPWAFSVHDFEPITGRIHQPPPVHQTFEGDGWVLCSFCPRMYDYHPESIPAPYNHSNVGMDEVLYYCTDKFMSRKGIEYGSITLHPDGMPHGPHPGKAAASIGKKKTDELAVMMDTMNRLKVAQSVLEVEDASYETSWLD
jgi:homogentisate 1,2-dioxygenase